MTKPIDRITVWRRFCYGLMGIALLATSQVAALASAPIVTSLGNFQESMEAPGRLATDPSAHLFITEPAANRVVIADIFGCVMDVRTEFEAPLGIAIDKNGLIYLGEEKKGSVSVFDAHWNLLYKLGQGDGEFLLPNHIAADPVDDNSAYVADSRAGQIKSYTNGILSFAFGTQGTNSGELDFPTGIFVTTNQEIYVVDHNNDRVQVFNRLGLFIRKFKLGATSSPIEGRSQGITVDGVGRVYVADTFQGIIRVFDAQGTLLTNIGTFGTGPGQLRSPTGLIIDRYNRLFIAAANNSRVEIMGLDAFYHFVSLPGNLAAAWDSTVTYSVITGGAGPFTYQWQKDGTNLIDQATVMGSTSGTLTLDKVTFKDMGNYSVIINGPDGIMTGSSTSLRVMARPPTGTLILIF